MRHALPAIALLIPLAAHAQSLGPGPVMTTHLTGTTTEAALGLSMSAVGSGVNGPATAQFGLNIYAAKDNWFTSPTTASVGEIDGINVMVRQGGAGSDASGILVNMQNSGNGFLSSTEMVSSIVNVSTNTITQEIDVQDGVLDGLTGQYIGRVETANTGNLTAAIYIQNNGAGTGWGNILENLKNGVNTFTITDAGAITMAGELYTPGAALYGDQVNGSVDIGVLSNASATPFVNFNGWGTADNCRIINNASGQLTSSCGSTSMTIGAGTLNVVGSVFSSSEIYTAGGALSGDATNGSLDIGVLTNATATPYVSFNGWATHGNCEIINSGLNQLAAYCGSTANPLVITPAGIATPGAAKLLGATYLQTRAIQSGASDTAGGTDMLIKWAKITGSASAESIPACSSSQFGRVLAVKDGRGDAATNNITITPTSGTIDGSASYVISTAHGGVLIQCDGGVDWSIVSKL